VLVLAAVATAAYLHKGTYRIPSESMGSTLGVGERIAARRVSTPRVGDILVVNPPAGFDTSVCGVRQAPGQACPRGAPEPSDTKFVGRVVAGPGDRLSIARGGVVLNGRPQKEPFVRPDPGCPICDLPREITIPADSYFMMGDNRGVSADSRVWGPVPADRVVGKLYLRYWPPSRFGTL